MRRILDTALNTRTTIQQETAPARGASLAAAESELSLLETGVHSLRLADSHHGELRLRRLVVGFWVLALLLGDIVAIDAGP